MCIRDRHTTTDYEFRFDQPESPVILDARPNGLLSGKCYYQWKNQQAIQLTDDPVSYTHLDVYKRQLRGFINQSSFLSVPRR